MRLKKLFHKHVYPKDCGQLIFVGSDWDEFGRPAYLYQNFCLICSKRVQMLADDETLKEWIKKHEKEIKI